VKIQKQAIKWESIKNINKVKTSLSKPSPREKKELSYLNSLPFDLNSLSTRMSLVTLTSLYNLPILVTRISELYFPLEELTITACITLSKGKTAAKSIKNHPFKYCKVITLRSSSNSPSSLSKTIKKLITISA
jgi:hypothetical protein